MLSEFHLIRQLLCRDKMICLRHIPREHNRVADWIAKFGKGNYNAMQIFEESPSLLRELLKGDLYLMIDFSS